MATREQVVWFAGFLVEYRRQWCAFDPWGVGYEEAITTLRNRADQWKLPETELKAWRASLHDLDRRLSLPYRMEAYRERQRQEWKEMLVSAGVLIAGVSLGVTCERICSML